MKAFPCKLTEWNPDSESWIDDGERQIKIKGRWQDNHYGGMDLRDYFAAKAMQGIIDSSIEAGLETHRIAESAYRIADAMIKARYE